MPEMESETAMSDARGAELTGGGIYGYEPSFCDVEGTRTRYYDVGEGDPIVLIHGGNWNGVWSANYWLPAIEQLRESYRVIAFDRLGCGLTGNPPTPEAYRYGSELEHARTFLAQLDVTPCPLVGFSRGAGLAARIAVEDPSAVSALLLTNSATLGPPVGDGAYRRERLLEFDAHGFEYTDPAYIRYFLEQLSYRTEYITTELCETAATMAAHPKAERTAELMDEQGYFEQWEATLQEHMSKVRRRIADGALDMPVLYLYGRNDLTVPLEMCWGLFDQLAQTNPRVRLNVLNHAGHMLFAERPREFSRAVESFLEYWSHGDGTDP